MLAAAVVVGAAAAAAVVATGEGAEAPHGGDARLQAGAG